MDLDLGAPVEDLARALIDIPSVSGDETAIADAIEAALAPHAHLEVTRLGDAVIARTSLGRAHRVVLAGHIDTVPIKDNVPATLTKDGTELIGRGSVDMKSGVAVMLSLAAELTNPTRDVTYVFYDHEEVDASLNGLARVARERPKLLQGDIAILGEPTNAQIEGGCNGTMRFDVTIRGRAAHSARAWKGINAIHLAEPLLTRLADYKAFTVDVDGLDFVEGLNAVAIRGGIANNVIPDECTVTINFRFAPSTDLEHARTRVEIFVRETFAGTDTDYSYEITDEAPGARPGLTAPLVAEFARAVTTQGGGNPQAKQGWTDVALFGELGIAAVNYGPGNPELAHADDERCPVDQIHQCRAALASWLGA